jgi:hypothetical protein
MIVVVSVIVLLTGSIIVYSRRSESQLVFFREQSLLTAALLRAKGFSIETFLPTQTLTGTGVAAPTKQVCGWGIHFDNSLESYTLFQDLPTGSSGCSGNLKYDAGEAFETFELPPNVAITCLDFNAAVPCSGGGDGNPQLDVIFVPPDPTVAFHPTVTPATEVEIILALTEGAQVMNTRTFRITRVGQVNVE